MKKVFIHGGALLLTALVATLLAHIPVLNGAGLMIGVVGGAYGTVKLRELISKLPGVKSK